MQKYLKIISAGTLIGLAIIGAWIVWQGYGRPAGQKAKIRPAAEKSCSDPSFYLQNDEEWGDDHLGQSGFFMRSSGCLTTSMAAALEMQKKAENPDFRLPPGELNQLFSEHQVYNENGDIVWGKINNALKEVKVYVAPQVEETEIAQLLEEGKFPLIKVRIGGNGAIHWIVIVGAAEETYLCMDPLNQNKELTKLSEFNNTVYAMRCVYWE